MGSFQKRKEIAETGIFYLGTQMGDRNRWNQTRRAKQQVIFDTPNADSKSLGVFRLIEKKAFDQGKLLPRKEMPFFF